LVGEPDGLSSLRGHSTSSEGKATTADESVVARASARPDTLPVSLCFIDYEYSGYNYRGFELGNHFCETYIDNAASNSPFYSLDVSSYPSDHDMAAFARRYLECLCGKAVYAPSGNVTSYFGSSLSPVSETSIHVSAKEVHQLVCEIKAFMLAAHLLYA